MAGQGVPFTKMKLNLKNMDWVKIISFLIPLLLFWFLLNIKLPYSLTLYFSQFSFSLFAITLIIYYWSFRLPERFQALAVLGWTVLLFALALSYKWTSGYSDNKIIGGLLPYKDGASYYQGAALISNGLTLKDTVQAAWRPLFSGFLASLLLLTGMDLKITLAVLVLIAGIGAYVSSRQIFNTFGPISASFFISFLYFYIQPQIGETMTELLGFTMGCFAFSLLWCTSFSLNLFDLFLGSLALVAGLSIRAGTFFTLPLLLVWVGWIFRKNKRAMMLSLLIATATILISFFLLNSVYVQWIGIPTGTAFGNFSFSLYGQVRGGIGWHEAIEDLGTSKPAIIYKAAFSYFLRHPLSLLVASMKSYQGFFLPVGGNIFWPAGAQQSELAYIFWGISVILIIWGLVRLIKNITSNTSILLIAAFIGLILSIPFLPPNDGGTRFYASTIPFFFALPAVTVGKGSVAFGQHEQLVNASRFELLFLRSGVITLSVLTAIVPLAILNLSSHPPSGSASCPVGQYSFLIRNYPDSYIDLVKSNAACGLSPEICLSDFEKNGGEKSVDDFYQKLVLLADASKEDVRIIPTIDLTNGQFRFLFVSRPQISPFPSETILSACAIEIKTKGQNIYAVKSMTSYTGAAK